MSELYLKYKCRNKGYRDSELKVTDGDKVWVEVSKAERLMRDFPSRWTVEGRRKHAPKNLDKQSARQLTVQGDRSSIPFVHEEPVPLILENTGLFVTILVCVYNRSENLRNALYSIVNQDVRIDKEIVVVNDGSTDSGVQIVIREYRKEYPAWNIREIYNYREPGFSNPGIAHNIGLVYAKGNLIIQSGCDIIHCGNVINSLIERLIKDEAYYACWLGHLPEKKVRKLSNDDYRKFLDTVNECMTPYPIHMPMDIDDANATPFCAIYRKEWVYKIGLYDEDFAPGGGEDDDFVYRMQQVAKTRWVDDIKVVHQDHPKFSGSKIFRPGYELNLERLKVSKKRGENRWRKRILMLGSFDLFPFPGFLWD